MGKLTKVQKDNKEINKNSGDRSRLEHPEKKLLQNRITMGWVICKVRWLYVSQEMLPM